jgi:hypothetical protein
MESKKLDDNAFPLKVDRKDTKTRDRQRQQKMNTRPKVAERLNDDALRRHEDNWSA